jgi:hypothetical protein
MSLHLQGFGFQTRFVTIQLRMEVPNKPYQATIFANSGERKSDIPSAKGRETLMQAETSDVDDRCEKYDK